MAIFNSHVQLPEGNMYDHVVLCQAKGLAKDSSRCVSRQPRLCLWQPMAWLPGVSRTPRANKGEEKCGVED